MQNTLQNEDHVLLLETKNSYKRGDIVVITKGDAVKTNIIKRIVATGGDSIMFTLNDDGTVNLLLKKKGQTEFAAVDESKYIKEPMLKQKFFNKDNTLWEDYKNVSTAAENKYYFNYEIPIEENYIYALGDNRNVSEDSRKDGPYTVGSIHRKSVLTIKKDSLLEMFLKLLYRENNNANSVTRAF